MKPCPFCSSADAPKAEQCCGGTQIQCSCGARGPVAEFEGATSDPELEANAVKLWDERAASELLAVVADPQHPEHEEACRVLLEIGWDLGRQSTADDSNPFRPKPKPPVPSA